MAKSMLAPDRVLLLLSLVPYLREHGPTPVAEVAAAFGVREEMLRSLIRFLGTAGVPGETLSYQHEDLFDIDWDALEDDDIVSLTRTVVVDDTPRFAPAETAALIAGLHALAALLPEEDAELARATAARLGSAFGSQLGEGISVTADPEDPRVMEIFGAIDRGVRLAFDYRDAAGTESSRTVAPLALTQGATGWYLRAHCFDRGAERTFRVDQLSKLREAGPVGAVPANEKTAVHDPGPEARELQIVARVRERALVKFREYDPEVLGEVEPSWVRVRVSAWHPSTAVKLVLLAPGDVVIEGPNEAVERVRSWVANTIREYTHA